MFNFSLKNKDVIVYTKEELLREIDNSILKGNYDLNYINTFYLQDISGCFEGLMHSVFISEWDVSNVRNFSKLFFRTKIRTIDVSNWDVSNGELFVGTFSQNKYLKFNVNNWNVSNGENFSFMFDQTKKQDDINLSNWNVSMGKNFRAMFLTRKESAFGVKNWDINNATDVSNMFEFCTNFIENISNWNWNHIKCIKYECILNGCEKFNFSLLKEFNINPAILTSSWFFYIKRGGKLFEN